MITVFSTAKPFSGKSRIIQYNAIRSWQHLDPEAEVVLFGGGQDTAAVARELGVLHVPDIATGHEGVPLISAMIDYAQARGRHNLQMYINCDIIMTGSLLKAVSCVRFSRFLLIGRRLDLDLADAVDFSDPQWCHRLLHYAENRGKLHSAKGIDYFCYTRGMWESLPPLAVGRAAYDNWLIYKCRASRIPVVDASKMIAAIHQNHDYSHHPQGSRGIRYGTDALRNRRIAEGVGLVFTISDADWYLDAGRLGRNRFRGRFRRRLKIYCALHSEKRYTAWLMYCLKLFERIRAKVRPAIMHGR